MITLSNVTKRFDGFTALSGLNLNVRRGAIYGLVGVNGSGKTTAIKHLAGIYRQNTGQVTIDGQPVYDNAALKARVGYIPDELFFLNHYNLRMLRGFYQNLYPQFNPARFQELLSLLGLDDKRRVSKFSKGMQKQAAFALVMSTMPDVLLLDEPIDGLDPIVRKRVFECIIEDVAERQLTVLVSSHNLKEMDDMCDAIGIIQRGTMAIEKDLDDLKSDVHKVQVAFKENDSETAYEGLDILHQEQRGHVSLLIVRGKQSDVLGQLQQHNPLFLDRLPLTLEEVFTYEVDKAATKGATPHAH